jgi:hypothetical protein
MKIEANIKKREGEKEQAKEIKEGMMESKGQREKLK